MSALFTTPTLEFPQSFSEKYRPRTIADFVGLEKPKRLCAKLAAQPFPSAYLWVGSSGTGKTTLALALAATIPAELHHIPSQECNADNLERVRRTCQYMPKPGCKMHLILIDEMDQMTQAAQLKILSYTDSTNFPPNTIIIGTANNTDRLEARTLSRFIPVEFSSYGIAKDTAALLERVWLAETGNLEGAPNFARIVKESNNNVRESLNKLQLELLLA